MNHAESVPDVRGSRFPVARIAFWMLASLLLCAAGARSVAGNTVDVPTISGGMGPCTAEFTVVDASHKPIYDAQIHLKVKYGFMSKRDTDLEVGTNSDGKKLRSQRTLQSVLDAIPGVGPAIRTSLLKTLGSARRVRESSVAELAAVPRVTPKMAQRIHDHFHPPGLAVGASAENAVGGGVEGEPVSGGER